MDGKYVRNARIIDRSESNGESFLFDPVTARFRKLNGVGTTIWGFLEEPRSIDELTRAVMTKYHGAEEAKIRDDLDALLTRLCAADLVERVP